MTRIVKSMEDKYLKESRDMVATVFTESEGEESGKLVGRLVDEIRSKKYYMPELEEGALEHVSGLLDYSFYECLK